MIGPEYASGSLLAYWGQIVKFSLENLGNLAYFQFFPIFHLSLPIYIYKICKYIKQPVTKQALRRSIMNDMDCLCYEVFSSVERRVAVIT